MRVTGLVLAFCFAALAAVVGVDAAELKPQTVEAFDRYVRVTETRMTTELDGEAAFLWVDRLPDAENEEAYQKLRAGEVVIEKLETRDDGDKIEIPSGKVHHWVGTVLIPNVTLEQTIAMVQDYDRYAEIYAPQVRESRLLSRDGNRFKVRAQLFEKKAPHVGGQHGVRRRVHLPQCHTCTRTELQHADCRNRAPRHTAGT